MATSSSSAVNSKQAPCLKTYFKTPEGRYKLLYEKTHPAAALHYSHGKSVAQLLFFQLTVAYLKEKPASQNSATPSASSSSSSVRSAAARLLGGGNGSRALSFVGGNGVSRTGPGSSRLTGNLGTSTSSSNGPQSANNYDGKGSYIVFNSVDTLFISDLNSQEKDPIKSIHFNNSNPVCHSFEPDAKDGHDLLIGLQSGDVYTVSLRQQLQDPGRKLVGAQHYNKDGSINNSRCTCVAWVPQTEGTFVVAHADGNLYVYEKSKDGNTDITFPAVKDVTQFSVAHAKSSKSNPAARWHICQGSINSISFSADGAYLATVGRDGYLRVFDFLKEQLLFGGKSYYGALLCCTWSSDGKYLLTGGEDDLVQVWSMEERKIVAWGEGHNSWVSGVAFDSYWSAPNSDGTGENTVYRLGSVGQDTQLLLWDLAMDEIAVPLRHPSGGSPTFSSGSPSAHWDNITPNGTLLPAPSMRDVPKLSPVVAHRVHVEPLSGLLFTNESILTVCREGHVKIWVRPSHADTNPAQSNSSGEVGIGNATVSKERPAISSVKVGANSSLNSSTSTSSSFKQQSSVLFS
ncbi:Transducin/WD40 repeat-like superfamily protein [Rhynchospora pubera]|uniref:Transducin/WD40 repeat-like superfamily protein n=1 Tax=Rhynchospora pubera TaxID=906938 RepID=A0AAV8HUE9_9POAL|nr:Transducin/WD40 repeat-like superfamily protein [Rhynchospora pubera]